MTTIASEDARVESFSSETIRWQNGDTTKVNPFFVLVINNIALERPYQSGVFVPDMNSSGFDLTDKGPFTDAAEYLFKSLFGRLPGQVDKCLGASPHASKVRFHSIYVWGLVANGATALVGEETISGTGIIIPRRAAVPRMLQYIGLDPDIVFVVTKSPTNMRASAFPASDDLARGGVTSTYDGQPFVHRYFHSIPGMAAIHATGSTSLTGAHEFGHAFSAYPNAFITDLYVDGPPAFNRKSGRPIPGSFAEYNGTQYASDKLRDGLSYPSGWTSYHGELADPNNPVNRPGIELTPRSWTVTIPPPRRCLSIGTPPD